MIFCLIELCLQPSAQNVTFISDTDLQKRDHLLMRGHLPLLFFMTMVSRCVSLLQPSTSEKELHWPLITVCVCYSTTTGQTSSAADHRLTPSIAPELMDPVVILFPQDLCLNLNKGKVLWSLE